MPRITPVLGADGLGGRRGVGVSRRALKNPAVNFEERGIYDGDGSGEWENVRRMPEDGFLSKKGGAKEGGFVGFDFGGKRPRPSPMSTTRHCSGALKVCLSWGGAVLGVTLRGGCWVEASALSESSRRGLGVASRV